MFRSFNLTQLSDSALINLHFYIRRPKNFSLIYVGKKVFKNVCREIIKALFENQLLCVYFSMLFLATNKNMAKIREDKFVLEIFLCCVHYWFDFIYRVVFIPNMRVGLGAIDMWYFLSKSNPWMFVCLFVAEFICIINGKSFEILNENISHLLV